ncbi:unnamed protein product [Ceratitis capitata]|uniref:(Mediterranean fruit fly) hypothetical protein n=1 Tax=Ceratitis capitata TaxID=7213 RepID=A0A811V9P7_CERCA|nr:unnamed protein product [Ceratitis capitata]
MSSALSKQICCNKSKIQKINNLAGEILLQCLWVPRLTPVDYSAVASCAKVMTESTNFLAFSDLETRCQLNTTDVLMHRTSHIGVFDY